MRLHGQIPPVVVELQEGRQTEYLNSQWPKEYVPYNEYWAFLVNLPTVCQGLKSEWVGVESAVGICTAGLQCRERFIESVPGEACTSVLSEFFQSLK